jgi:hypothetical protein
MNIDQMISVLKKAKKDFGGHLPVQLQDSETGDRVPIMEVQKTHPRTGQYGCTNRGEPVNGVLLLDHSSSTKYTPLSDLAIYATQPNQPQ